LNRRALQLHEDYFEQTSWSRGAKDEKGEAAYLFRVSLSSVNRYAKMVPSIVN
jgi:hypothetical protein